jgi:3-phosphoglycerate kinase
MARNREFTVIGGGDTGAAVRALGYPGSLYRHVSTVEPRWRSPR